MLEFTDVAKERVRSFVESQSGSEVSVLRIAGNRAEQRLWLVKASDVQPTDRSFDGGGFTVLLDPLSAAQLQGATVDFVEGVIQSGFRVYFPTQEWDDPLAQKVQDVLDTEINPGVASHGGTVSLVKVQDGVAYITFGGGCQGCGAADLTLKQGIDRIVRERVPEIHTVMDDTDHDAGENPYYSRDMQVSDTPLTD